jgi:threonine/homoserine/homoserine lactone efflux protein
MAFIATRTLAQGRAAGFASMAGVAAGNFTNAVVAALGLAALLALWPAALLALRVAGGGYLLWLAFTAWFRPAAPAGDGASGATPASGASPGQVWRQGFWVALLNPKTALFFAAFLPPFLDPAHGAAGQSVVLGALFVAIAALSDSAVVLAAGALAGRLSARATARAGRALAATVYAGLGLFAGFG